MHVPCDGTGIDDGVESFADDATWTVYGEKCIDGESEGEC